MKVIYSYLKKLLPDLDKPIEKIADDLSLIGHMSEGIETVGGEQVINLEIRQNRGDCLGYYGLAKELAVLYNLEVQLPETKLPKPKSGELPPITISAEEKVKRIMSLKINKLKNKHSPSWLKEFLAIHDINSINTLVDLTNYVMLFYGLPCHAFDAQKVSSELEWKITNQKEQIITLDRTKIEIPKNSFIISDNKGAASLPIIGGKRTAIDLKTKETIIEMAIYDPLKIRLDAKKMNIQTDAKIRLEKDLDTNLLPIAFKHLTRLILKECGGEIVTKVFDYYPNHKEPPKIKLNINQVNKFAGIDIPDKFGLKILKNLGCKIKKEDKGNYWITPPTLRKDINLKEDLIEEIIRFYGYNKIPTDQPISSKRLPDITPKVIYLNQAVKNILANMGYDEIRSWPIIKEKHLHRSKILPSNAQPVRTENSVNENYPLLRMSLASSLFLQDIQYKKYKLPDRKFFEIGKIYYQENNSYHEVYSVAFYQPDHKELIKNAKKLLKKLGLKKRGYQVEEIENKKIIEMNLTDLAQELKNIPKVKLNQPEKQTEQAIELTQQIISLDANVFLDDEIAPEKLIRDYIQKINSTNLWKLTIIDIYETQKGEYKYTFRAYYYNLSAQQAKQIHSAVFHSK